MHHVDGDPLNDSISNLVTLCTPCHQLAHTPHAKREKVVFDQIVSIGNPREEEVFDMTMDPQHNFVGDGFILHNCIATLHAESNAIDQAGKEKANGATIYTTVIPCFECAKRIINAGIVRVVYSEYYESRKTSLVTEYFERAGVSLEQLEPNLAAQLATYMTINEARRSLDLPDLPGGDIPLNPVYLKSLEPVEPNMEDYACSSCDKPIPPPTCGNCDG